MYRKLGFCAVSVVHAGIQQSNPMRTVLILLLTVHIRAEPSVSPVVDCRLADEFHVLVHSHTEMAIAACTLSASSPTDFCVPPDGDLAVD